MKRLDNFSKFSELRKDFSFFSFDSYQYIYNAKTLEIIFHFSLADKYFFKPAIRIPYKSGIFREPEILSEKTLDNLVFQIGLIELISYWKAACPPRVIIKPHVLSPKQIIFWKNIYFNGLGEFFYVNTIPADSEEFMDIETAGNDPVNTFYLGEASGSLVPVGGGKDSAVTMGLLNQAGADWVPFILNPRRATREVIAAAGKKPGECIEIYREIDRQLLDLNDRGFLNGHTPFSALLAFYSLLAGYLGHRNEIILSNESSANEATVPGTNINHQYSKSFDFENDFRVYVSEYISQDFNYYSLLRPLSEIQIARAFSKMPEFFDAFKSCNAGSKENVWCGKCPKCLFTFIILSPFLLPERLYAIFRGNPLDDPSLEPVFDELTGFSENKPFDCVGTITEVNAALDASLLRYDAVSLPYLLKRHKSRRKAEEKGQKAGLEPLLQHFDPDHFVPEKYYGLLKNAIK
ncbi:MAG: hypothetical protein K0B08_04050 [Bacteroidales bacterium]|nr:hypothetical protein [Bacteroidales bacterium]